MPIKGVKLEDCLKKQLDIKYSAVSQLIKEAKTNLEIDPNEVLKEDRELEVLDEAIIIYEDDLTDEERADMKQQAPADPNAEPEWKRKARLAAEKREREWAEEDQRAKEEEARRQAARRERKTAKPPVTAPVSDPEPVEESDNPQGTIVKEETIPQGDGITLYITTYADGHVVKRTVRKKETKLKKVPKKDGEVSTCFCVIL